MTSLKQIFITFSCLSGTVAMLIVTHLMAYTHGVQDVLLWEIVDPHHPNKCKSDNIIAMEFKVPLYTKLYPNKPMLYKKCKWDLRPLK